MRGEPLYLRGNIWWCRVRNPNGGRALKRSTGCRDRKAAVIEWRRLERESVESPDQAANKTTLGDSLDTYITERQTAGKAEGTIHMLRVKARQLNRVLGAETKLNRIGAAQVDDYCAVRLKEGAARTTIQKERSTLGGCLKLAKRHKKFAGDVGSIMGSFAAEYKPRERALSFAEIERLLEELQPKRAAVVAFILSTAATYPSELAKLTKADVDTKAWKVRLRGTKRTTRDRVVPIVQYARAWVTRATPFLPFEKWTNVRRELHDACERLSTCAKHRDAGEVHPVEGCKACDRCEFARVSPNDLRRTTATLLRAHGIAPGNIFPILGHADGRMVERIYGRISPDQLGDLLDKQIAGYSRGTAPTRSRRKTG